MTLKQNTAQKSKLHPKNLHNDHYDFARLEENHPLLSKHTYQLRGRTTLDFSDSDAVIQLNCALLKTYYKVDHWQIPDGYLCPPIPGRVDYIHYLADLLQRAYPDRSINSPKITVLDIGTGASCIYPILGQRCYQWSFIGSDIDPISVNTAKQIIAANPGLAKRVKIKQQKSPAHFFEGILDSQMKIDLTMCNPPFHRSLKEALSGNKRKRDNLQKNRLHNLSKSVNNLNFGGQQAELFCQGGELQFIKSMVKESKQFAHQVLYFSTLVSKTDNLNAIKLALKKVNAVDIQTVKMHQGNKTSRFIAWSFLDAEQRRVWKKPDLVKKQTN